MTGPEPIRKVLPRAVAGLMPPLDADGYLAWLWKVSEGTGPAMNAYQWWLAFQRPAGLSEEEGRKAIVSMAAHNRRRARLERMAARRGSRVHG